MTEPNAPIDDPSAEFLVSHAHRPRRFSMDVRHFHARHEIYYLLHGERNYFIRDRVYHIVAGDLVLIAANELHKTSAIGAASHERLLVEFMPAFLSGLDADLAEALALFADPPLILKPGPAERQRIEELFSRLLEEFSGKEVQRQLMSRAILTELLIVIQRLAQARLSGDSQSTNSLQQTISAIAIYINANFRQSLGLSMLAERFSISPSHLSRNFARVTGFKFAAYIASVRLREARHLLVSTDWPIARIAGATGFASTSSFGRLFLAQSGVSPLRYRKMQG